MLSKQYVDMLQEKDIIFEIAGQGRQRAQEIGADNVFNFSLGNPSVPAPPVVNETIINILNSRPPQDVHSYGPSAGLPEARQAIADSLRRRFGLPYEAKHIFMSVAAAGALAHAFRAVVQPGEEVLTFAPCFSEYKPYVSGAGGVLKIVPADVDTLQINFEALDEMMNPNVAAVLVNSPNNPSGVVLSTPMLDRLAAYLTAKQEEYGHTIYLISDEPYREIIFEGVDAPVIAAHYPNTISCYSFSKSLSLPGERIGYLAVNPAAENAETIIDICPQISRTIGHNGAPTLMQIAVALCADETGNLKVYEKNKNILYQAMTEYGYTCVEPGGTFYMFPRSLEPDDVAFCKKAQELDLFFIPGSAFGCPGHFRLAYCVPEEKVLRALPKLKQLAEMYGK